MNIQRHRRHASKSMTTLIKLQEQRQNLGSDDTNAGSERVNSERSEVALVNDPSTVSSQVNPEATDANDATSTMKLPSSKSMKKEARSLSSCSSTITNLVAADDYATTVSPITSVKDRKKLLLTTTDNTHDLFAPLMPEEADEDQLVDFFASASVETKEHLDLDERITTSNKGYNDGIVTPSSSFPSTTTTNPGAALVIDDESTAAERPPLSSIYYYETHSSTTRRTSTTKRRRISLEEDDEEEDNSDDAHGIAGRMDPLNCSMSSSSSVSSYSSYSEIGSQANDGCDDDSIFFDDDFVCRGKNSD